jgi:hypothetical protein
MPGGAAGGMGGNGANGSNGSVVVSDASEEAAPDDFAWKKRKNSRSRIASAQSAFEPVAFVQSSSFELSNTTYGASNALLAPRGSRPALVRAGNVRIRVERGAAAFVICDGRQVHVLSLHDGTTGDVSVAIGDTIADLRAGEALIVREAERALNARGPLGFLPIRNLREHEAVTGQTVSTCEFSLPAAINLFGPVRNAERSLYRKIEKNACVLQTLGAKKGTYRIVTAARIAMSP